MARGRDRHGDDGFAGAPWWAVALIVVGIVIAAVLATITLSRKPHDLPQAEIDRMSAAEAAAQASSPQATAAPVLSRGADGVARAVFAGDSLTYGLFASSEAAGFRPQVVAALEASGPVEATRGGQTGNTVAAVSETISFPADTNLVVLELGTNDVYKTEVGAFGDQYQQLVDQVTTSAPDAQLICLGVWSNADGARNYDPLIQGPCTGAGGTFLQTYDLFDDASMRGPEGREAFGGTSDDFHPNDAGYAAIAARVLTAVAP